jgi:hypothetical protein
MPEMELVLSLCLGIGLAAACGFRVFVPLLGINVAALSGHLALAEGFEWLGTWPAFGCFLSATVLEITAYYVPWLDNLLDTIATPAAVVAGTIVTASVVTDMSPLMQWSLALIAGGGTAGIIQSTTVVARGTSTATTAGMGNFVLATGELVASIGTTLLAMLLPILCAAAVVLGVTLMTFWLTRQKPASVARAA